MNKEEKVGLLRSTAKKGGKRVMYLTPWLLFVISLMVSSTSMAGEAAQCPADALPIQITDEIESEPKTMLSKSRISDTYPHFRAFVTAVTQHVAARLSREKLCTDSADSKKQSLLHFVKWPLATSGDRPIAPVHRLEAQPSGGCRISSPWIDLAFERRPVPWGRAVVRWSQRQLLVDQALLAGARNVPTGLAMPLKQSEFIHFAEWEYASSELLHEPAAKPIEKRVPPELLWLFRHAWQSTRAPFSGGARNAMNIGMEKGAESYTQLVIALIDRCFVANGAEIRYRSILDAAKLISLEQYKITTLTP